MRIIRQLIRERVSITFYRTWRTVAARSQLIKLRNRNGQAEREREGQREKERERERAEKIHFPILSPDEQYSRIRYSCFVGTTAVDLGIDQRVSPRSRPRRPRRPGGSWPPVRPSRATRHTMTNARPNRYITTIDIRTLEFLSIRLCRRRGRCRRIITVLVVCRWSIIAEKWQKSLL